MSFDDLPFRQIPISENRRRVGTLTRFRDLLHQFLQLFGPDAAFMEDQITERKRLINQAMPATYRFIHLAGLSSAVPDSKREHLSNRSKFAGKCLHNRPNTEKVILLSLVGTAESHITMGQRLEVTPLACSLWHVISYHGYMQDSDAPKILIEASKRMGCPIESDDTFFVLPREMIVEYVGTKMPVWQRKLFGALSRNMSYAPDYFFIPCTQIVQFNWMLKA